MSGQSFTAFAEKVQQDAGLRERLEAEAGEHGIPFDTVARIAAGEGYEFAVEDLGGELSEEQLDSVVGGGGFASVRTVLPSQGGGGALFPKVEIAQHQQTGVQYLKWYFDKF